MTLGARYAGFAKAASRFCGRPRTFAWAVLLRPWGGLKRLFGIYPAIRAAAIGMVVATIMAGVLGGAALNVAAAAAATALPLLTVGAMRALEHAADRTRAVEAVSADTPEAVSPG